MNTRVMTGIVSFCVTLTGLFLANMVLTMMIGEINRKRQDGNLVSYVGFTFPKMLRIFNEYRTSYPSGKLHIYALAAFAFAMIGLVSVAVCLRIVGYGHSHCLYSLISVCAQHIKQDVRLGTIRYVVVITPTVRAPLWRVHQPVVMLGAPVCRQMNPFLMVDEPSRSGSADRTGFCVDHRESGSVSVWEADRQLSGTGALGGLDWESAATGTYHQTGEFDVALLDGGSVPEGYNVACSGPAT